MSWKKHFTPVHNSGQSLMSPLGNGGRLGPAHQKTNYSSFLPDIYAGVPNRLDRYMQYDTMDMDSEVNAALDILSEFCTQLDDENNTPFHTYFREPPTATEVTLIKSSLQRWCKMQKFETRIFRIVRNAFKYGDCFFLRDPQTKKWFYLDSTKIVKIIANESDGKTPMQYVVRDINFNFTHLVATTMHGSTNTSPSGTSSYINGGAFGRGMVGSTAPTPGTRFSLANNEIAIDAKHIVHISLSEGLNNNYPFGDSLLESVFKVYKQKELLEDAVIIYRVQRAPERRVFYIDVGNMPPHMAMGFVDRVKNEIQQRRIPSATGGYGGNGYGTSTIDASYNPIGINEDFYFPATAEGRGSKVETLPGGCLAMDTKIPLLDGRVLTLSQLTDEYNNGISNWAFSTDLDGNIAPGIISWAGITQQSAKVLRLTFDTGESIICTPDHKFPITGKGKVRADEMTIGESFIPFNARNNTSYPEIYQASTKLWQSVHIMVLDNGNPTVAIDLTQYNKPFRPTQTLIDIEWLDDEITVGTLTIDNSEQYHDYHNFALDIGIFTQNSSVGEVTDLRYFTNKLFRALRIPASYLPTGPEDGETQFNDGKVGTAYIQELRFNKYLERLQSLLIGAFDVEFKLWMQQNGLNIDSGLFELKFNPPLNFASYRQSEMDGNRITAFTNIHEVPYVSKRFALKRYLGWTQEEITQNEKMWQEENSDTELSTNASSELRSAGITPTGISSGLSDQSAEAPPEMTGMPPQMDTGMGDVGVGNSMDTSTQPQI